MRADGFSGNNYEHSSITRTTPDTPFMLNQRHRNINTLRSPRFSAPFEAKQTQTTKSTLANPRSARDRFEVTIHRYLDVVISYAVKAQIGRAHLLRGDPRPENVRVELDITTLIERI